MHQPIWLNYPCKLAHILEYIQVGSLSLRQLSNGMSAPKILNKIVYLSYFIMERCCFSLKNVDPIINTKIHLCFIMYICSSQLFRIMLINFIILVFYYILFRIYINDIQHPTSLHLLSYADDTTIYADSNADILYAETNKQLIKLDYWFRANKLSLNAKKTNYSIFSSTKFTQETNRTLTLNNTTINREHSIRLLGLNIDQQLTWNTNINKLKSKTSSSIFIINRVKKQLPHEAFKSIYLTLIHSHCIYGITAWGNSTTTKNYTFIHSKVSASHTDPLFKQENVLKFHDIYTVVTALYVHDLLANKLPSSFDNYFPMANHYTSI